MDAERARDFLLKLPLAEETKQWGDNLVFWVGDKALGGKMFCVLNLDSAPPLRGAWHGVASYSAGPERYAELLEREGLKPAPYMARIHWVAVDRWSNLRNAEWESELRAAYEITKAKLTPKAQRALGLLPAQASTGKTSAAAEEGCKEGNEEAQAMTSVSPPPARWKPAAC